MASITVDITGKLRRIFRDWKSSSREFSLDSLRSRGDALFPRREFRVACKHVARRNARFPFLEIEIEIEFEFEFDRAHSARYSRSCEADGRE
jgi:hypothetical protein